MAENEKFSPLHPLGASFALICSHLIQIQEDNLSSRCMQSPRMHYKAWNVSLNSNKHLLTKELVRLLYMGLKDERLNYEKVAPRFTICV